MNYIFSVDDKIISTSGRDWRLLIEPEGYTSKFTLFLVVGDGEKASRHHLYSSRTKKKLRVVRKMISHVIEEKIGTPGLPAIHIEMDDIYNSAGED